MKKEKKNKKIKLGICGEHGGDPKSIHFCSKAGLNYVSCSPYRVPIARLAAAQAEIKKIINIIMNIGILTNFNDELLPFLLKKLKI